jgi:putative tricarboxylic transport membrane protein
MVCGLVAAVVLARGSLLKSIAMVIAGLLLGTIGLDVTTGQPRFTFGIPELYDGIGLVPLAIGLFGLAEIMVALRVQAGRDSAVSPVSTWRLGPGEARRATAASIRGTLLGSALGTLPGGGPLLASFASYALEKKVASGQPPLGAGAIAGVAGPESANNAAAQASFIPLLTLGLPSNGIMALLLGALIVHGVQPGPDVIVAEPALFWGLVASMWIGNLLLLLLNLPLAGLWARLLRLPYRLLYPTTIVLACTGIYALGHSTFDLSVAALFGVLGYLLRTRGFEPAPLLLGFVLSQPLEEHARRALLFANGDPTTFLSNPVSAVLLATALLLLMSSILPWSWRARGERRE